MFLEFSAICNQGLRKLDCIVSPSRSRTQIGSARSDDLSERQLIIPMINNKYYGTAAAEILKR